MDEQMLNQILVTQADKYPYMSLLNLKSQILNSGIDPTTLQMMMAQAKDPILVLILSIFLGGFGVEWFTPVINLPQSGILGVGTIVPRPKDLGGGVIAFVPYLGLSLTYDHRALDGGEATRFLKQVATEIETLDIEF